MKIRTALKQYVADIYALLSESGWAHRLGSIGDFGMLLEQSQRTAVAVNETRIAGFARGITDGISNGYLSMVAVAPDARRCGIGTQLIQHVMGENTSITWVLRAGRPEAHKFFSKLGYQSSPDAMEHKRRSPSA